MAQKNFLDQFSSNNKPDSFKEEVFVPSKTPKKPLNITLIVIAAAAVVITGFLIWFFVLRPTIEVPSFIGKEVSDVNSWIKQQGIQASGIVFEDEYSEDVDAKLIIDQSISEGKKVKKDVKMNFTISKGPDPSVEVKVPDIISMNLREIESWINDNKLTGIKITYEFSDTDPLDSVISYEFGNSSSETNFKRSSSLTIVVSKGKQEDQPVSVPNFVGKNISEVTTWGSKNKIKIKQKEGYSGTVNKDMIISQSVNPGKKITSKESLTVTVSKGEAIYAPDFSSYSRENIVAWGTKNNVNIEIIERYSKDVPKDKVIEQSHKDKPCNDGLSVTISLGNIGKRDFTGTTLDDLKIWINEVNQDGADLHIGSFPEYNSDTFDVGEIFDISDFNVGSTINGKKSIGRNILLKDGTINWNDLQGKNESEVRTLCTDENNDGVTCSFTYVKETGTGVGTVKEASRSDGEELKQNTYISQNITINIIINAGS